mgnify:CR=1 FL=1|tara:strand:+ start:74 stop:316 length:243 start_codon:yes stop_codon:yes gene_type:complete
MIDKIKENIKVGFGAKETAKTAKGAAVGGMGACAYSILSNLGYMPDSLQTPDVVPYVVAGLSAIINSIRQFFTNNTGDKE